MLILKSYLNEIRLLLKAAIAFFFDHKTPDKRTSQSKRLLIVKLDAIGDYILFRNCIEGIYYSEKYKGYKIDILLNSINLDFFNKYDSKFIDNSFSAKRSQIHLNQKVRNEIIDSINSIPYSTIVNWTYSRHVMNDLLVRSLNAPNKISFQGDCNNIRPWLKHFTNRYYTRLFENKEKHQFEFYKNLSFLHFLTGENNDVLFGLSSVKKLEENSIISIVPGASDQKRRWPILHFVQLIELLQQSNPKLTIMLLGSSEDKKLTSAILARCKHQNRIKDLSGKHSLAEIPDLLAQSSLVVCCESGIAHISAATNSPYLCISNGNHFGRFHPYPRELNSTGVYLYPKQVEEDIKANGIGFAKKKYGGKSHLNTDDITANEVFNVIKNRRMK